MMNFSVQGMTCGGCARAVSNAIQRVDPAASVEVDVPTKKVAVQSAVDPERIRKAIEDAGYTASLQNV